MTVSQAHNLGVYAPLVVGGVAILFPAFWMVSASLQNVDALFDFRNPTWWPDKPLWSNYTQAWTSLPFNTFLSNTLIIAACRLVGELWSCSLVAFGFARLTGPGKKTLFAILLGSMMLPGIVAMIPVYVLFSYIGWVNTFKPFIVPSFFAAPFFVFLLRQFFLGVPNGLHEAATIDGASNFQVYHQIFLPLAKAPLIAIFIFVFQHVWNDFMGPLIYLQETHKFTMALGLQLFRSYGEYATRWDLIMAASVLMTLPPMILVFIGQKYFVEGFTLGAIKG